MAITTVTGSPDEGDEPIYELVEVTPELAEKWLQDNTHNRNIRTAIVAGYAADMLAGAWVENGQSIRFAKDGTLLDGQHRLSAIKDSGVTLRMMVVRGLANDTQMTMDTGAKRTFADVLRLNGESNATSLAAACLRVYQWKQGIRKSFKAGARPTHRQLLDTLQQHPELRRSVEISDRVRRVGSLTSGAAALCHWLFLHIDPEDCAFFFARLGDGAGLMTDDPIYALRRALDNLVTTSGRPDESYVIALVIKAWNAYRAGESVQLIVYRPGGSRPEKFPEPK